MKRQLRFLLFLILISTLASCGQLRPESKEIPVFDPPYLNISQQELETILAQFGENIVKNDGEEEPGIYEFEHDIFSISYTSSLIMETGQTNITSFIIHINEPSPLNNNDFLSEFYNVFNPIMESIGLTYEKTAIEELFIPEAIIAGENLAHSALSETVSLSTGLNGGFNENFSDATGMHLAIQPRYAQD